MPVRQRVVLHIKDLARKQDDQTLEKIGPAKKIRL